MCDYTDYKQIEMERRQSLPEYTDKEWLQIFPEIKPVLPHLLKEVEIEEKKLKKLLMNELEEIYKKTNNGFEIWLLEWVLMEYGISDLVTIQSWKQNFKNLIQIMRGKKTRKRITEQDIENAKNVSIIDVIGYEVALKHCGATWKGLCPFHEEKTPSFTVYTKTNSYYCFGCQKGGNTITFVMLYCGLGFIETVKKLKNNY